MDSTYKESELHTQKSESAKFDRVTFQLVSVLIHRVFFTQFSVILEQNQVKLKRVIFTELLHNFTYIDTRHNAAQMQ